MSASGKKGLTRRSATYETKYLARPYNLDVQLFTRFAVVNSKHTVQY